MQKLTLKEANAEAKRLGLSYGQYVAQYRPSEEIPKPKKRFPILEEPDLEETPRETKKQARQQRDQEIAGSYRQGKEIQCLAQEYQLKPIYIQAILVRQGAIIPRKTTKYQDKKQELKELAEQGLTNKQIAQKLGISESSAQKWKKYLREEQNQ